MIQKPKAELSAHQRFRWGWLRLFLGFAQMSLVAMSVGALLAVGLKPITWIPIGAATLAAVISRLLYAGRKAP